MPKCLARSFESLKTLNFGDRLTCFLAQARARAVAAARRGAAVLGKRHMGSALMGSLQLLRILDGGTF